MDYYLKFKHLFLDPKNEQKLVERAKIDTRAFGELYDIYYKKILNFVFRNTTDIVVSQDLTADTFCVALQKIKQFEHRIGANFGSWLYKIASNFVLKFFRDKKKYKFVAKEILDNTFDWSISDDEIKKIEDEMTKHEDFAKLNKSIGKLDVKYQIIVRLRYFEEKGYEEISFVTGEKVSTLKSQMSRALDKLKIIMEKENG